MEGQELLLAALTSLSPIALASPSPHSFNLSGYPVSGVSLQLLSPLWVLDGTRGYMHHHRHWSAWQKGRSSQPGDGITYRLE